ncbi:hypothetical protein ASG22_01905 [Chryseobacterium sp. Leaf405]|uniref:sulfite exporter TauE/SafE family protein n=1 Tax=Chryseobacterium sp. Leaf405 TaxID=1736367 RepID=UPI0006F40A42|nr:sulfite exporter TauE/SafE family protein [Chryseobacterium sp. Leaf405]KQT35798.1 hypothetical protein ASG22_01905 [Chryseobacterium sp. Leaf405]
MSVSLEFFFLFVVAFSGGVLSTTVSGGWFFVFPGLIFRGLQPVISNATTMLVLWSGHIATSDPIKKMGSISVDNFKYMLLACISGGVLGAFLLIAFPYKIFESIGPFLLLGSFILFISYENVLHFVGSKIAQRKDFKYSHPMLVVLFLLGIYGAYFGAGMGMIIFILYRFYGIKNNDTLEKLATVLVAANNGIALIIYTCAGLIFWPFVLVMVIGSVVGSYCGILLIKKVNTALVKKIMIGIGAVITLYFLNVITLNI